MNIAGPRLAPSLHSDIAVFLLGGLLVIAVVYGGVPLLSAAGMTPLGAWMVLSLPFVFLPIIGAGLLILRSEDSTTPLVERLRLRKPTLRDLRWCGSCALSNPLEK